MSRHQAIGLVALSALLTATGAVAQPASQPTSYTFVAQWQMPRAQWANFIADFEKNTLPVLEKMGKNGTLAGWGAFEAVVHTEEGFTHGIWWSSATTAGIEQTRAELVKASAASGAIAAATGHRDSLPAFDTWQREERRGKRRLPLGFVLLGEAGTGAGLAAGFREEHQADLRGDGGEGRARRLFR